MSTLGDVKSLMDYAFDELKARGWKFGFLAKLEEHFGRVIKRAIEQQGDKVSAESIEHYLSMTGLGVHLKDLELGKEAEKEFKKFKKWLDENHVTNSCVIKIRRSRS